MRAAVRCLFALMSLPWSAHAQTITTIGAPGTMLSESAAADTLDSYALVAFRTVDGDVGIAKCVEGYGCTRSDEIVDARMPSRGRGLAVAVRPDRRPILSYYDADAVLHITSCDSVTCAFSTFSGGIDTGDPASGANTSIAIGTDGNPVIAYYDENLAALRALMCTDPDCAFASIRTIDDDVAGDAGRFNDVVIGADGSPVFSYYDATRQALKAAWCASPDCVTGGVLVQVLDEPAGADAGKFTSIAIGADGFPLISYQDVTQQSLRLIECRDLSCDPAQAVRRLLDNPLPLNAQAGAYTSLVVPADGRPVVSYLRVGSSRSALTVARCVDSRCSIAPQITHPDPGGTLSGIATSMTIVNSGLPLISHYDLDNQQLKVVRCDTPACDLVFADPFEN
jgi:hypothetical protein